MKKRILIIARIFLAIALGMGGIYAGYFTPYWMVSVWCALFFVILVVDLVRVVERSDRDLANLLLSIRQSDFTNTYPEKQPQTDHLYRTFNVITGEFRKLRREKETSFHFLQAVVEHSGVPLLAFEKDTEQVTLLNQEAKTLFGIRHMTRLHSLSRLHPQLLTTLRTLQSGEKVLIKADLNAQPVFLSIAAREIVLEQKHHMLIALHNINSELDQKEIESWQKLIRILSHEIKNSVIPISTLAEVLTGMLTDLESKGMSIHQLSQEESDDLILSVRTIEKRSKGLVKFVSAYSDLAKVPKPELVPGSVQEMVEEILKLVENSFRQQGITLLVDMPKSELTTRFDKDLMSQVLINLMKNSLEAMAESPIRQLSVAVSKGIGDKVVIRLSDTGSGMDAETVENIFVPFYTTKKAGTGIGLSLSRQIVRAHGGTIRVASAPEKGTTFEIQF